MVRWTRGWSFVAALVAFYVLIGLWALSDDRYLNDEGILTYLYAEFLRHDFATTFFFLKAHPALALLTAPAAALGLSGFFVVHVLIGAAGLVFIAIAARRAGVREVGIAPLVLATSPLYVQGGASGIGNVDGVAIGSGALALTLGGAPGFAAGLVAGILPFVRFELGLLTLTLALIAAASGGRWRYLAGLSSAPLAYCLAGALYHGSAFWFLAFPPAWGQWDPAFIVVADGLQHISAEKLMRSIALSLPALPLLLAHSFDGRGRRPVDVPLAAYVVSFVAAIMLLPFGHIAFGFDDRYYLTALPAVALLAAGAADRFGSPLPRGIPRAARLVAAVAGGSVAAWFGAWSLAATSFMAAAILAADARLPAAVGVAAVSALLLVAFVGTLPRGYGGHAELHRVTDWLREHRGEFGNVPIYTNMKLLAAFASRSGGAPELDIIGVIQPDTRTELLQFSNPDNGQRERMWQLVQTVFYGRRGVDPAHIVEGHAPPGALLVLNTDDLRTEVMFPQAFLGAHTRTLHAAPGLLIATVLPPAAERTSAGAGDDGGK